MKNGGILRKLFQEALNKYDYLTIRHSGESRYPLPPFRGKVGWGYIISYWMPVFTGMTVKSHLQSFLKEFYYFLPLEERR